MTSDRLRGRTRCWRACVLSILPLAGCFAGEGSGMENTSTDTSTTGDGDGDPTGDGDGDPTGDGDGDPTGDGDGDPTGDGDGDPATGDGDGEPTTGDGDGDPEPTEFWAGVDTRSIDPSQQQLGTIYLGGFGAPFTGGTATAVHDSVYARSMAIGYGDEGVIFSVVDATGMGNQITRAIREQAANLTGLPTSNIVIATTHTHAGPDFQGLWGGVGDSYKQYVINETVGSMLAAWQTRVPSDLSVSNSSALNNNRRDWDMTDDTIFVLQAHRQDNDELLGTMMSFAAHPVIIGADNTEISRDYCGYVVDALEATTAGPVIFFNGILGDVSPSVPQGMYNNDFEEAEAYGTYVADQAALMLESAEPVDLGFYVGYDEWELDVTNALFNLAGQLGILLYDFEQGGFLDGSVVTQSTYVRLGTMAQIVTLPGESLTRHGLPIKEAMNAPYKAALGNANDALGYFVPSDEWQIGLNDNYEEGVSLGMDAGDITQGRILDLIEADGF